MNTQPAMGNSLKLKVLCLCIFSFTCPLFSEIPGETLLTSEKKNELLTLQAEAMNLAWQDAKENTPEGFVFVQGDRYTRENTPRDRTPKEELLLSFYMGDREITQEEYQNIIGDNPSSSKDKNKPVENVSWYNAIEYCNKRSLAEGLSPYYYVNISDGDIVIDDSDWNHVSGKSYLSFLSNDDRATGYRLPNDAEWEYAAMGGVFRSSKNPLGNGEQPNALGLYDTEKSVREWTDTRTGYWNNISVRGGSWSNDIPLNEPKGIDVNEQSELLGFRVVRNIPQKDCRYPALVFSDRLNVRTSPGLGGQVIRRLDTLTPIAVYEFSGTATWSDGVLDVWLRISKDEWINGNYVVMLPFSTETMGEINTLSELMYDITDSNEIRKPGYQSYDIDVEKQALLISTAYLSSYYCDKMPFYGFPELHEETVSPRWLYADDSPETEWKWWHVEANYDSHHSDDLDTFPRYKRSDFLISSDGTIIVDEGDQWSLYYRWSFSGKNTLTITEDVAADNNYPDNHKMDVYFLDPHHMIFKEQQGEGIVMTWCTLIEKPGYKYFPLSMVEEAPAQ